MHVHANPFAGKNVDSTYWSNTTNSAVNLDVSSHLKQAPHGASSRADQGDLLIEGKVYNIRHALYEQVAKRCKDSTPEASGPPGCRAEAALMPTARGAGARGFLWNPAQSAQTSSLSCGRRSYM